MPLIFVFSLKKTVRMVKSLSYGLKKGQKMEPGVINTPLHDNKFLLKLFCEGSYLTLEFVYKGEKYSLRNTSRIKNIETVGYLQHNHNL